MGIPNPIEVIRGAMARRAADLERRREEARLAAEERRRLEEEARQAHIAELMEMDEKELLVYSALAIENLQETVSELSYKLCELESDVSVLSYRVNS